MENRPILDACCGGRMFWFDKKNPHVIFLDRRVAERGHIQYEQAKNHEVKPDVVGDFRNLPFADKAFKAVIFDPPHLLRSSSCEKGYMVKKYGCLHPDTWKEDIKQGFAECWRVLDDYGTLTFKWNEAHIPISDLKPLFPTEPLIGTKCKTKNSTHWYLFMKIPQQMAA
jgi:hypothetical protein